MTFKAHWEKTQLQHQLCDEQIQKMLVLAYPDIPIKGFEVIDGGCANINVRVDFLEPKPPVILRVYVRDSKAAHREQIIAKRLIGQVPIPQIHQIDAISGYTFAIAEFMPGITLRDLLLGDKSYDVDSIMFKVGQCLSQIAATRFSQSGFFNEDLSISETITQAGYIDFGRNALNGLNVKFVLSEKQRQQIDCLLSSHGQLLPDGSACYLVHADFDPANILVHEVNGQVEVSGILDWEFAFSGSTLTDVANMLRDAHHMPKAYEDGFIKGLVTGGYALAENWRMTVDLLNLLALLDCIKRSDPSNQPNRINDVKGLIRHILSKNT